MLQLVQKDRNVILVLLFLLSVAFLIFPEIKIDNNSAGITGLEFTIQNVLISKILKLLFLVSVGFFLVSLNYQFNFFKFKSPLAVFLYVLLNLSLTKSINIGTSLIAFVAAVYIVFSLLDSYKQNYLSINYFNIGLALGIGSLIYYPLIFLLPFVYISYVLLRPLNWRELIFPIVGAIIPYIFLYSIFYLRDMNTELILHSIQNVLTIKKASLAFTNNDLIYLGLLLFVLIISSIHIITIFMGKKVYTRRVFAMFLWLFIITLILMYFFPDYLNVLILINTIPLSFLFTHYFINVKPSIFNNLLFLTLVIFGLLKIFVL